MPLISQKNLCDWKTDFAVNIRCDPTTRKTWQEIEKAGIASEAAWLLFWYAKGQPIVEELPKRSRIAVAAVRTALRAIQTAQDKQGDLREALFVKRAQEKISATAKMPWISPYSRAKTLAQAAAVYPIGNLAKDAEKVRRSGTMELLLILQPSTPSRSTMRRLSGSCANARGV